MAAIWRRLWEEVVAFGCMPLTGQMRVNPSIPAPHSPKTRTMAQTVYNLAFDAWGRLATVCYDGYLRLYDANFKLLKKVATTGGKKPFSLAFSPNGKLLAVGYNDSPTVQVLDASSLSLLYAPDVSGANALGDRLDNARFLRRW